MIDQLIRGTAAGGGIRLVGAITTSLTAEARARHHLSYVATAALGRAMTAGLLLAAGMKRPGARVNIRVRGDGPLGGIFVDAGLDGTVRGYVDHPEIELPPNPHDQLDVGRAVGKVGYLYVLRDVGYGYPYSGTVELVSGEIGDDVAHYLAHSEQIPSVIALGSVLKTEQVMGAGGLLVQVLPKAAGDPELLDTLESRFSQLTGFTPLLQAGLSLKEVFGQLFGDLDLEVFPEVQLLRFYCPCSFDRMLGALKLLGLAELQDMVEKDHGAEAVCHFCNQVYQATEADLTRLIQSESSW